MNKYEFQTIMPVKPGTISADDKAALKEIGVVVIEHEDPGSLRLITPLNETSQGTMLRAAIKALQCYPDTSYAQRMREHFANTVFADLIARNLK
jgi:hypothetical protein